MHQTNSPLSRRLVVAGTLTAPLWAQPTPNWQTALQRWRGVRPRLMLTNEKLTALRSAISGTHRELWEKSQEHLNLLSRRTPPPYARPAAGTDPELYQRDNGDWMCQYALLYLLGRNPAHLASAQEWALASCGYPTWATGQHENADLAAGHQLFGLAMVYDWLQSELEPAARATIRRTLLQRAGAMYAARNSIFWRYWTQNNHVEVSLAGLTAAALALFDDAEATEATRWVDFCLTRFRQSEATLAPDGANREGIGYWDYGTEYLLKFWQLAADLLGEQPTGSYLQETAFYRLYLTLPRANRTFSDPLQVDLGDSPRTAWYGPDTHLRRLAALSRNPQAQWYANDFARTNAARYVTSWLNYLWFDPTVEARPFTDQPTLKRFSSLGIVSARSDWGGSESLVVFKCGAPFSDPARPALADELEAGHVHPDANHFVLFGEQEFLVRDDGYLKTKLTANHNTLLVEGKGQKGEGFEWFDGRLYLNAPAQPRVLTAQSNSGLDYIAGEAAPAYSADQGVRKFVRHLLYVKPNVLLVIDDIEMEKSATLELRFHPESETTLTAPGTFESRGRTGRLRTEILTPGDTAIALGESPRLTDSGGASLTLTSIRLRRTAVAWRNVTAFSWSGAQASQGPAKVTMEPTAAGYAFAIDGRRISFSWSGSAAETTPVPAIRRAQPVLPAFGGNPRTSLAANGYLEIYGENLAATTRAWEGGDFKGTAAPTSLDGTAVRINGKEAFVYFVSPNQINVNVPEDPAEGPLSLQVIRRGVPSNTVTVNRARVGPALLTTPAFLIQSRQYVVALPPTAGASGPYVGAEGLIPGVPFVPVKPGDRLIMYVLGAGPTNPPTPAGVVAAANAPVASPYQLTIGGRPAAVEFFGVVQGSIGLYQINAVVPALAPGDHPIELTVGGVATQQNLYLSGVAV